MKFRIVKTYITCWYIDSKEWDKFNFETNGFPNYYESLANDLNYVVTPVQLSNEDKPHGYRIESKDGKDIPAYSIWYLDEFDSRFQGWKRYKWSEFHDRSYDDTVLNTFEAEIKCKECKTKIENYYRYGKVIKEIEI